MGENEKKEFHLSMNRSRKSRSTDVSGLRRGQRRLPCTYFRGGGGRDVRDRTAVGEQSVWKAG